jgi:hypothetical protein
MKIGDSCVSAFSPWEWRRWNGCPNDSHSFSMSTSDHDTVRCEPSRQKLNKDHRLTLKSLPCSKVRIHENLSKRRDLTCTIPAVATV